MQYHEMNPWFSELINSSKKEIDFCEIKGFLNNPNITEEDKNSISKNIKSLEFEEIKDFILQHKFSESSPYYIGIIIKKVKRLNFYDIEEILYDENVWIGIKMSLVSNIKRIGINHIYNFITDNSINIRLRRLLAEKILFRFDTKKYLKSQWFNGWVENQSVEVNMWQFKLLTKNILIPNDILEVPKQRTLNFYCRKNQWAFLPHFEIFIRLLRDFIDWGNSKVWNKFRVLTRWTWEIDMLWWVKVSQSYWTDFRSESSIYSDTIHMTHGTPEKILWTHSMVWEWLYRDRNKIRWLYYKKWDYSKVPLLYCREWEKDWLWLPIDMKVNEMCSILINSVLNAEDVILLRAIS